MMDRRIKSYAVQITWDDGGTEIREDHPSIPYIEEWMDAIELEENKAYNMIVEENEGGDWTAPQFEPSKEHYEGDKE
jgi:hypothetical protein